MNLKFLAVAALVVLMATPSQLIGAQTVDYTEGETPVFEFEPNPDGYGGLGGELVPDGIFEIGVFFPQGYPPPGASADFSIGPDYYNSYLVTSPTSCSDTNGGQLCLFEWNEEDFGEMGWVDPGEYKLGIQYDDEDEGRQVFVAYIDENNTPQPHMTINLLGQSSQPIVRFDGSGETKITDPQQKIQTISVFTRTDQNIKQVDLAINDFGGTGKELVTITDFTLVNDERYFEGQARRYDYEWNIEELESGRYLIDASAVTIDGQRGYAVLTGNTGRDFIGYTLAVDVNEKLQAQCEENKGAVDLLIDAILDDMNTDSLFLEEATNNVIEFRQTLDLSSPALEEFEDSYLTMLNDLRTSVANATSLSTISCAVSLRDDIDVFKAAHDDYKMALDALTDALVDYSNTLIEEAR